MAIPTELLETLAQGAVAYAGLFALSLVVVQLAGVKWQSQMQSEPASRLRHGPVVVLHRGHKAVRLNLGASAHIMIEALLPFIIGFGLLSHLLCKAPLAAGGKLLTITTHGL